MTGICIRTISIRVLALTEKTPSPASDFFFALVAAILLSAKARDIAVVHRALGDDADLNAVAERIVAVGGVGIRLMPGDEIGIWAPVGFFAVKAFEHFRVRLFV